MERLWGWRDVTGHRIPSKCRYTRTIDHLIGGVCVDSKLFHGFFCQFVKKYTYKHAKMIICSIRRFISHHFSFSTNWSTNRILLCVHEDGIADEGCCASSRPHMHYVIGHNASMTFKLSPRPARAQFPHLKDSRQQLFQERVKKKSLDIQHS